MKKNKFLRLASLMLMLCLITTCAISGTFAKYTTSKTSGDDARVAKWGLTITLTDGEEMFAKEYDNAIGATTNTVVSTAEVLAPGTAGEIAGVAISGTPEVAFKLTVDVNLNLGDKWTTTGSDVYCPIVFKVGTTEYKIDGTNDTTAKLESAIEAAIITKILGATTDNETSATGGVAKSVTYYPNSNAFADVTAFDIEWSWVFEGENAKDTILGNKAAAELATIDFDLVIDATQIN